MRPEARPALPAGRVSGPPDRDETGMPNNGIPVSCCLWSIPSPLFSSTGDPAEPGSPGTGGNRQRRLHRLRRLVGDPWVRYRDGRRRAAAVGRIHAQLMQEIALPHDRHAGIPSRRGNRREERPAGVTAGRTTDQPGRAWPVPARDGPAVPRGADRNPPVRRVRRTANAFSTPTPATTPGPCSGTGASSGAVLHGHARA